MLGRLVPILLSVQALASCGKNQGVDPPGDRIFYPTGMAVAPDGRFLFVASSNFDIAYNGGTIVTVDLGRVEAAIAAELGAEIDERELIVAGSAVEIGTFANEMVVTRDGTRIFTSVRGDNSVTFADVAADGHLNCSPDPAGDVPSCRWGFVLGREENGRGLSLPNEPHGLALHESDDGGQLFVAHADDGEVSMFENVLGTPELTSVSDDFPPGSTGIALRESDDSFLGYVTSRAAPVVTRFVVAADFGVQVERSTPVEFLGAGGVDQRGIAFSPDFGQAYLVSRFPESLLVLDTASEGNAPPPDDFVDAIEVASGPAVLAVDPGTGLVYVSCFRARKVFVVDPVLREVVNVILTGDGPHTIVFDPTRRLAYVALFTESTIAVIDVDPASPFFHQRVLTIGIPDPPETAR